MKFLKCTHLFLGLICAFCYFGAFFLPMWSFALKAPQYPAGLSLQVYLDGTRGDVFEIDIINHYIGMQKLALAAQKEKMLAPWALGFLAILAIAIGCLPHTKLAKWLRLALIGFPPAFVAIFYFWLYKFGHELSPLAPVDLPPFTPTILGTGIIGQFQTFALPGMGFYLICLPAIWALFIKPRSMT